MSRGARGALIVMLVVLAAMLAGCGGSSGSTQTVTTTTEAASTGAPSQHASTGLTMPEFIAAADAICTEENARIKPRADAISARGGEEETPELLDTMADEVRSLADEIEKGLARLRALTPPPGKLEPIESMLNLVSTQAVLSRSVADALSAGDGEEVRSLGEQLKLNQAKYRGLAQGLGFGKCGAS